MPAEHRPPIRSTAREWALAAGAQPDADITAAEIEPVLVEILEQLLELTVSDPFPIRAARRLGARLCAEPLHQVRMLALVTRTLLGFPAGPRGSLVATQWPLVASQAIDSYAQALQELALAQQKKNFSDEATQRVREFAALQQRLEHEATHDALTGLANRTLLRKRVRQMADHPQRGVGLLVVDLDRFKQINDNYGHAVGDEVLVELAQRLRAVAPPGTVVCRYGGDEFVLAAGLDKDNVAELAANIVLALNDSVWTAAGPVPVSASVGTTYSPPADRAELAELLRRADLAMYSAKTAGGRRYVGAESGGDAVDTAVAG
ncbi:MULTISPECIES: GGDEF domain-containing protein [Nocardia]|uniref:GGDEF domain-containing protein n=1 Tax=Nocardia TaxID=1817 RepID=UPI001893DBAF|nr:MULTISPECIES: GGDEF domain-containing protein [Nocardia]MBF6351371.1 diguanylate cyclase [Nocardia flavorosea]